MDFAQDGAYGEFTLRPGETATFVLEQVPETYVPRKYSEGETREAFEETVATGAAGCRSAATRGAGARSSTARR